MGAVPGVKSTTRDTSKAKSCWDSINKSARCSLVTCLHRGCFLAKFHRFSGVELLRLFAVVASFVVHCDAADSSNQLLLFFPHITLNMKKLPTGAFFNFINYLRCWTSEFEYTFPYSRGRKEKIKEDPKTLTLDPGCSPGEPGGSVQ